MSQSYEELGEELLFAVEACISKANEFKESAYYDPAQN